MRAAGPGVILSYIFAGLIALLLMGCLSEMAVAHPTAGSFGVYAEIYLSNWAASWCATPTGRRNPLPSAARPWPRRFTPSGGFPNTPAWAWVVFYSVMLIYVNARSVGAFGAFEYWFSMIKVSAIVVFILLGVAILLGIHQQRPIGLENFRVHGGFLPKGWTGAWLALSFVIFSYIGTEIVAVTAGEARDPERAVPRAMRTMLARLVIFYVGAISILVGVIPWTADPAGAEHHRQSVRARLRSHAHSGGGADRQLRSADGGAVGHELLSLSLHANDLLALARRLCAAIAGPRDAAKAHRCRRCCFPPPDWRWRQ